MSRFRLTYVRPSRVVFCFGRCEHCDCRVVGVVECVSCAFIVSLGNYAMHPPQFGRGWLEQRKKTGYLTKDRQSHNNRWGYMAEVSDTFKTDTAEKSRVHCVYYEES